MSLDFILGFVIGSVAATLILLSGVLVKFLKSKLPNKSVDLFKDYLADFLDGKMFGGDSDEP